jgi:hypothetical protein
MKSIFAFILAALCGIAVAQTVTPNPVQGIYVPVTVDLPYGGSLRWNSNGVDQGRLPYVTAGTCTQFKTSPAYPGLPRLIGYDCSTAASVFIQTTGQLTSTCPVDGGTSETVHLTLTLNGQPLYDAPLLGGYSPCYNTPPLQARVSFAYPVVTFDNSAQPRDSATTVFYSPEGAAYLYSSIKSRLLVDPGLLCSSYIKQVGGTRWKPIRQEVGFKCEGTVPANSVATVTIQ